MIETIELYGGEIQLQFDSARHQYRVVNKGRKYKVPSVTAVCGIIAKPALISWAVNATVDLCKGAISPGTEYAEVYLEGVWDAAKRASQQIKQEAARKGTERHREIEAAIRLDGDGAVLAWQTAGGESPFRHFSFEAVERRIFSRRYRYSGTFDALAKDENGKLFLIDWKTSKAIYAEYRLQTAAYTAAYEEEFPSQKIEGRYLVRVTEDGQVEPHYFPRSTQRTDFKAFRGALDLFRRVQQIEKEFKKSVIK